MSERSLPNPRKNQPIQSWEQGANDSWPMGLGASTGGPAQAVEPSVHASTWRLAPILRLFLGAAWLLAMLVVFVPASAEAHDLEGDIVITENGFSAPPQYRCSSIVGDGTGGYHLGGRYVYCIDRNHPLDFSEPYDCTLVTVLGTALPDGSYLDRASSWCPSMSLGASCPPDGVNVDVRFNYCFNAFSGSYLGGSDGSEAACLGAGNGSWTVTCHFLISHRQADTRPDLSIVSIQTSPASLYVGEPATTVATIINAGGDVGPFKVRMVTNASIFYDVPGLASGDYVQITDEWIPKNEGRFAVWVDVDPADEIEESDESDNSRPGNIEVKSRDRFGFALDPLYRDIEVRPASTTDVTLTLTNTGNRNDVATIAVSPPAPGWSISPTSLNVSLAPATSVLLHFQLSSPADGPGTQLEFAARSQADPANVTTAILNASLERLADLTVEAVSVSPDPAMEGDAATLTARLSNIGNLDLGEFAVRFLVDGTPANADSVIMDLAAGATIDVVQSWTTSPGNHIVQVVADPAHDITEQDETNNEASRTFDVRRLPDFAASDLFSSPANPMLGETATLTATILNLGGPANQEFAIRFLVEEQEIVPDQIVAGLDQGSTATRTIDWTPTRSGPHTIWVIADPANAIRESNEANNERTVTVTVSSPPMADLTITQISTSPANPVHGQSITLSATMKNAGDTNASGFTVAFFVDGAQVGEQTTSPLRRGASTTVSQAWTAVEGSHEVRIVADVHDSVAETDEANNEAILVVDVGPRPAFGVDLSPPDQRQNVKAKGTATYTITVTNTGTATDTIDLGLSGAKSGWTATLSTNSVTLAPGASTTVQLTVKAANGGELAVTVKGTSRGDPTIQDTSTCTTKVGK